MLPVKKMADARVTLALVVIKFGECGGQWAVAVMFVAGIQRSRGKGASRAKSDRHQSLHASYLVDPTSDP